MKKAWAVVCIAIFMGLPAWSQDEQIRIQLETVTEGILSPVAGFAPPDGSGRMFIVEQTGRIRVVQNGQVMTTNFLDLRSRMVNVSSSTDERGLLGMALHPDYNANGRFFVYYSAPGGGGNHSSVIAEYRVSADNPNVADSSSARTIMTVVQPEGNHNGGCMAFGHDGMLYVGFGDGGGANDQHGSIGNGQNLNNVLGAMIRINVDGAEPYEIPSDNPFVGIAGEDEIWAYGLRNPWRFSIDRLTGRIFAGDVGQSRFEEVDIIERGGNYGWRVMEASSCFNPPNNCNRDGLILPIAQYGRSGGFSITGGYVYRGRQYSSLYGKYIFADWSGQMYYLTETSTGDWDMNEFLVNDRSDNDAQMFVTGFAEDEQGEVYILGNRVNNATNRAGMMVKITVPGDEPVGVEDWIKHQ